MRNGKARRNNSEAQGDTVGDGNSLDIEALYKAYSLRVKSHVKRYVKDGNLADDIVQETFLRVSTHGHTIKDRESVYSWLLSVAKFAALNHIRGKDYSHTVFDDFLETLQDFTERDAIVREGYSKAMTALESLPRQQREAVFQVEWLGKTFGEIASETGQKYNTVKANYRHGVLRMRHQMKKAGIESF